MAFHAPLRAGRRARVARRQVVQQERVLLEQEPGLALGRDGGAWSGRRLVGQRGPVVLPDRVRLDDDVVVVGLGVEGQLGLQLRAAARRCTPVRSTVRRQPHVGVVDVHAADVPVALDRVERPVRARRRCRPPCWRTAGTSPAAGSSLVAVNAPGLVQRVVAVGRPAEGRRSAPSSWPGPAKPVGRCDVVAAS